MEHIKNCYPEMLALHTLPAGKASWRGVIGSTIDFALSEQLYNEALWQRLEDQFCDGKDDQDGGWRGEYWGKMMRGACMVYTATGDETLYRLMADSVKRLLTYQTEDGTIASYSPKAAFHKWDMWCRKYVLMGMLYFVDICKDADFIKTILSAAIRHADAILAQVGPGKLDITATTDIWGGANSCSILEPMVRLYEHTGEARFLGFASYIVERGGSSILNIFEAALAKRPIHTWGEWALKAYETMSCFEGLLHYACAVNSEKWLTAAENFVRLVMDDEITLIGSAGCRHELFGHSAHTQFDTEYDGLMLETCVSVTWMKLCWQLFCLTGDCKYADQMERTMFNAYAGALNREHSPKNSGMVYDSYSPLYMNTRGRAVGGFKIINGFYINGCCVAIASAGAGLMGSLPVMQSKDGILVNTFAPGSCTVPMAGGDVRVTMETAYPAAGTVRITVESDSDAEFPISIRIPAWSANTTLVVGGVKQSCTPGAYTVITRCWKGKTTLILALDFHVRTATPADYSCNATGLLAYEMGPLVLARDARFGEVMEAPVLPESETLAIPAQAPFHTTVCRRIRQANGDWITLADYASCGTTWDENSLMSAWLPC